MDLPKGTNPQKKYIKNICQVLYYLGLCDCWYEETPRSQLHRQLYQIWQAITLLYTFSFITNEFLAHFRNDLDDKEHNDLVQFSLAHTIILAKIIYTYFRKDRIHMILERLLEGTRSLFVSEDLDKACKRQSVKFCVAIIAISYMTIFICTVDGVRAHLAEGIPIRTEVTFYPSSSKTGLHVNIMRFFIQFHWWYIVAVMLAIDCICICCLITAGYKFKLLQVYFNNLREKVLENEEKKSWSVFSEKTLCAKNVQFALGFLCSVQVYEGVVLVMMGLIKFVTVERNMIYLFGNFGFIACCIQLTGAYMLPAGDITHEASLVSTAMFHSGWELVSSRRLRALLVLALQRSQVPVYLTAFGMITLSYASFITVIRSAYSFFAVMY